MYYEDLSKYEYTTSLVDSRLLNFGWLSADRPFRLSRPDDALVKKLGLATANFVNAYRGTHPCDFCGAEDVRVELDGRQVLLGHAETWIPSADGRIFIAPTLVYHYVVSHSYHPPGVVIAALGELPDDVDLWDTPDGHYRRLLASL